MKKDNMNEIFKILSNLGMDLKTCQIDFENQIFTVNGLVDGYKTNFIFEKEKTAEVLPTPQAVSE